MKDFVIHNSAGVILQTGSVIEEMLELQGDPAKGRFMLEGTADYMLDHVAGGEIKRRPRMPYKLSAATVAADGISAITLSGVPAGAAVRIAGPASMNGTCDGSDITLTFALAGRYSISLELFPYINAEEIIHAV